MSDLRELYQEVILDHGRAPRNFHDLQDATHHANGFNPLCGDKIRLFLRVDDEDIVREACFEGAGCAISTASASLLTEAIRGKKVDDVRDICRAFRALVTGPEAADAEARDRMGKLAVFEGVREFPNRVKCATLACHALEAALEGKDTVSTE